jgi:hypothetical protein
LMEGLLTLPDLISENSCERHKPLNGSRWPGRGKRVKAGEICNALAAALLGVFASMSVFMSDTYNMHVQRDFQKLVPRIF